MLASSRDEKLLKILNNTPNLKIFDYVANVLIERDALRGDDELTDTFVEFLIEKRNRVIEVQALNAQFELTDEAIAFEEAINEALFKTS